MPINLLDSVVPTIEALLMTPFRIKRFKPKAFIYQIYIGDDLIEFSPPTDSKNISLARRCYWWLSTKIQVLNYLNFRFRFIRELLHSDVEIESQKGIKNYSVENYSQRTKMLFQADPYGLENSIFLKNGRDQDIQHYLSDLKKLLSYIPEDCPIFVLVIRHCI